MIKKFELFINFGNKDFKVYIYKFIKMKIAQKYIEFIIYSYMAPKMIFK